MEYIKYKLIIAARFCYFCMTSPFKWLNKKDNSQILTPKVQKQEKQLYEKIIIFTIDIE